ncbi:ABC transporter ATP-binding protein [Paraburkholderia sp.]|uniref:ABC transporter ATP-binding protein n=1 Tax=Paraburkholderia sp. TaxID=1926495 RepID=UPI0025E22B8E|nr:ABC transporter ATP-binding protein [Paraburkholderia sp.]
MNAIVADSRATGAMPLLHVTDLSAGYGEAPVLAGVSLDVHAGELVALVGSNGAGKTTLLRALSGLIPVGSGDIVFNGVSVAGSTSDQIFRAGLTQLPEGRQLFDQMTVEDNLLMGANLRNDRGAIATDLERMYAMFPRLKERRRQIAGTMSGGEQQMCAMARALMSSPRVLMVDEMSLGLAPVVVLQLMEILQQVRTSGVTVLLIEQDVHLALEHADRGYVLETGRIVLEGPAGTLLNNPEIQAAYLGV